MDLTRSEIPPPVPRSAVSAREDATIDPLMERETEIPSEDESSRLEPCPPKMTKLRGEVEEEGSIQVSSSSGLQAVK